jgi:hypothetical protein
MTGIVRVFRDETVAVKVYPKVEIGDPPRPPPPPPPPPPERIDLDSGAIAFGGGVSVGGNSHATLFRNGTVEFSGHFHESGAVSHDVSLNYVIRGSRGTVFTLEVHGRVHGTFEAGSRNFDWDVNGGLNAAALAAAWDELSAGYYWTWTANATADWVSLLDGAIEDIKKYGPMVGQAIALVA